MTPAVETLALNPSAADLRAALEQALSRHFGVPCRVARLERRPSAYRTSFAIEELDVWLENGMRAALMLKDLSRRALAMSARRAKPAFLFDPLREIATYRAILGPNGVSAPTYFGSVVDRRRGRYWLFLERVAGLELYQIGDLAVWQQVARWLASMHARFPPQASPPVLARSAPLLLYDGDFYRRWARRALGYVRRAQPPQPPHVLRGMARLAGGYDRVVDRLLALPATFLHGEFYASNVLVQETAQGLRVCPVDWEMAAVGPGLIDLAALTSGTWSEEERRTLAMAYYDALPATLEWLPSPEVFWSALDYCRLHLAVQWVGWSQEWSPPPEHAHDWLGEALGLAEKVGV